MMRNIHLTAIIIFISFTVSFATFQVEEITVCDSINNELTSKFRFLGSWDSNGVPDYLDPEGDEVSQTLIDFVKEALPEGINISNSNDNYFGDDVQLNTELIEASEVHLTMVHEGAGWTNTLGFYTYDVSNPPSSVYDIDSLVVIFPNVTQPGVIKPGDKVLIGEFPAKTGIGYFLVAQGWVGDTICLKSHMVFSDSHLNTFTSEEFRQQTILLNYEQEDQILLGFEDIKRPGGDNDFNDAVFYITAEPGAIDTTDIAKLPTAFISGDTTLCNENDPAIIRVDLKGQAPWTIVYTNGIDEVEISSIEDSIFLFETLMKDTITLVSVNDKNKIGIVSGKAIISVSQPKATLKEDQLITCNGENENGFVIDFEGQPPFSLTYLQDNEEKTINDIMELKYELIAPPGSTIKLASMSDLYCDGTVSGESIVRELGKPTLEVEGNGAICGEDINAILNLKLGGEGPWFLNYQIADQVYDLQIESSEYQLEVAEIGTLTFNSIEDANCSNTLSTSIDIQKKSLPTAIIENHENYCGDETATVNIALSGEGPWQVHYTMNSEPKAMESTENLLDLLIDEAGVFELIGLKDAFCENSAEGTIEFEIHVAPTAVISSNDAYCNDAKASIQINLTGTAPFSIVYTDGENEIPVTAEESLYEFITSELKTYTLVSVTDANCTGEVDGEAVVNFSQPKATLKDDQALCGANDQGGFIIDLEGQAPYSLTFLVGSQEKTVENITENQFEVEAPVGSNVKLISMRDQFCEGTVVGEAIVRNMQNPTLAIEGSEALCGDDANVTFDLKLEGQGPWVVNYQIDNQMYDLSIDNNEYQLEVSETGTVTFNSVEDANCEVALFSSFEIQKKSLPTASIEDFENSCGDNTATVDVALTGEGPWQVQYSVNGEMNTSESSTELMNLSLDQSGTFELVGVKDTYCENVASGSIEVEIHASPTAFIGDDVTLCKDEEATIQISLTGVAPFTFIYTDGENETSITTEENLYEFSSSEFETFTLLSVTDANCAGEVDGSATIFDGAEDIQVEIDANDIACFGDVIELVLIGETDGLSITWSTEGKGTLENVDQIATKYTPADNEIGIVVFFAEVSNSCAVRTISKEVTIIEEINVNFSVSPKNDLVTNIQIVFTPESNDYDEYSWDFGDGNSSTAVISSTDYSEGGIYTVELSITINGCEGSGSTDLEVLSKDELYVPNAFNPGAQNPENRVVKVYGNNVDESGFSFKIVNRWGKTMYQTSSFLEANSIGWDGVNNINDESQELSVFTYILKGRFIEGDPFERAGTVTQVK